MTQPEDPVVLDPRVEIGTRRRTGRRRGQVDDLAATLAVGVRVINRFGFNSRPARQMEEANQRHLLEHVHGLVHRPQGGGRHLLCNPLEHRVDAHVGGARVNGAPRGESLRRHAQATTRQVLERAALRVQASDDPMDRARRLRSWRSPGRVRTRALDYVAVDLQRGQ